MEPRYARGRASGARGTSPRVQGGRETRDFGDLGQGLAAALRRELQRSAFTYDTSAAGIRATAIGAGQFTMQVSGITIHRSHEFPLPLRNGHVAEGKGELVRAMDGDPADLHGELPSPDRGRPDAGGGRVVGLSLIHISEPTRRT